MRHSLCLGAQQDFAGIFQGTTIRRLLGLSQIFRAEILCFEYIGEGDAGRLPAVPGNPLICVISG